MTKTAFSLIDFNCDKLIHLAPTPEDFCDMWKLYLNENGWTEEEYEQVMLTQIFSPSN